MTAPDAAEVLAQAIRIRTVNPPGDEAPLARYFADLLQQAGLETAVIETPRGRSRTGRAATWSVVPGAGGGAPLVLLSHLDTVPADPQRWRDDPFAGVVRDGHVIGRGAQDAKGVAVVHLLAMLELARRPTPLERDVVLLAVPDEESGGRDGSGWLARERRALLRGAGHLLTEGGGVLAGHGGTPTWQIAVAEKTPCWLRIAASGPAGHGSVPSEADAVPRLLDALERLRSLETPVRVVPEAEAMFAALAPASPPGDRRGFAALGVALERDPAFRLRFLAQPSYAALVRDTYSLTVLRGSTRTNVLPPQAVAHVDARLLPGSSCEAFTDEVRSRAGAPGIEIEVLLHFPFARSEPSGALYRAIAAVARRSEPDAVVVPRFNSGFSDAHWFRELGIESYGFVPRWHALGEARGVHGPNERISVHNLERGVATLVEIVEELDRQER